MTYPRFMSKRRRISGFVQRFLPVFFFGFLHSHFWSVGADTPIGGTRENGAALGFGFGASRASLDGATRNIGDGVSARRKSWSNVGVEILTGFGTDDVTGGFGSSHPNVLGDGFLPS